jgi:peroxiredoxin
MKNLISFFIFLFALAGCNKNAIPPVSGEVKNVAAGTIYLQRYDNKSYFAIDSAEIVDGKFRFVNDIKRPEIYGLSLDNSTNPTHSYLLFLDKNPATIKFDTAQRYANTVVSGSNEHLLYKQLLEDLKRPISDVLRANPKSIAALYIFYRYYSYRLSPDEIRENLALLDTALQNTDYARLLLSVADNSDNVAIGKKAPDFHAVTIDGKDAYLSDYLGKGYVLIDFWASWCRPCRKESPELVALYNKFKNKGLKIVGLSLDRDTKPWLEAIKEDNYTWTQLIDLNAWAGEGIKTYNVRVIPSNYLIDADGIIVAKNLRGEDLEKLIETFY